MVAELAVAAGQCRCAQACKSAALQLQPKVAAGFMEKINASVEARCSACRDRKEKRATCGWHGMAAGGVRRGGVAACHRRGRLQAPARISRRRSGGVGWGVGREGGPETSLSPEADGDGEAEQTARYECTHDDGHEARWIWPRGHPRILTGQCARAPAPASA